MSTRSVGAVAPKERLGQREGRDDLAQNEPRGGRPRPKWSANHGEDNFGRWAVVEVDDVRYILRWIKPGTFWMGSPEDEEGRWGDEGPRREVTLTKGFWLGQTPCTQALWTTVMETNPSRFVHPERPVEQVSWEDCQEFLQRIAERVPGFHPRLPTEAEWEYACRAGTETSTYAGQLKILGAHNGPMLDKIAWYGGNSGVDFDLKDGVNSSGWNGKQFDHQMAGTRIVKRKSENSWGLYDMLGNVEEWCSDYWSNAHDPNDKLDPAGPGEGSERVVRSGAWVSHARDVRAAYRSWYHPENRDNFLGFRLALDPE